MQGTLHPKAAGVWGSLAGFLEERLPAGCGLPGGGGGAGLGTRRRQPQRRSYDRGKAVWAPSPVSVSRPAVGAPRGHV